MFEKYGQKIICMSGIASVISVVTGSLQDNDETMTIMFFLILVGFSALAYSPFIITGYIAKKNMRHIIFFTLFALLILAVDVYAKFNANASGDSTAGLVFIVMPVYLIGATLIMWGGYTIFAKLQGVNKTVE